MHRTIKINDTNVKKIQPPNEGRDVYRAANKRNLFLRVLPSGKKTFYVQKKVNGQTRRANLGTWPELTAQAAIKRATERLGQLQGVVDPLQRERLLNTTATLADLWPRYLDHITGHLAKNSVATYRSNWGVLAEIKNRRLGAISRADVQQLVDKVGKDRPGAANGALRLLALMFDFARENSVLPTDYVNPARGVRKFRQSPRKRYLNNDELTRLFAALRQEYGHHNLYRDFFLVCLLTGARRGNVASMRWDQLDLRSRVWTVRNDKAAGTSTKNREDLVLPLNESVLGILQTRLPYRGDCPWVFPSPRAAQSGHINNPFKAWTRITKRAGLQGLRIHDLRRTLAIWLIQNGESLKVVQEQLGHRNISSTLIYAHHAGLEQVRRANAEITAKMIKGNSI